MKRRKKWIASLTAVCMTLSLVACSSGGTDTGETAAADVAESVETVESASAADSAETEAVDTSVEDTIVVMVPPIITDYTTYLDQWIADFNEIYPNLKIEVIATSWDDNVEKLTTMSLSGQAPDIANIEAQTLGTYVDMGVAVSLTDYMDPEDLADYDENALAYTTLDDTVYGLPLYISIQGLGGNKAMLEEAGVDVERCRRKGGRSMSS